jgi:putative Mg2+ transporter-C (MgtC) family protein
MDIVDLDWINQLEMLLQILLATVLGAAVGFERELAERPAGLRTHALLGAAACLLVVLTDTVIAHFAIESAPSLLTTDPVRIIEAVVTGTAFLGAGTIFRHGGDKVEGLTTAASLLLVASIGIAVALRQIILAVLVTLLALALLRIAGKMISKH